MNIGIDGRPLEGKRTGVGRYVWEVCRQLDVLFPEARFFIYAHTPVEMPVASDRWVYRGEMFGPFRKMKSSLWLKARASMLCRSDRLDAFWGGGTFLPYLPKGVRTVTSVHDVVHHVAPETMPASSVWMAKAFFAPDVKRADAVLATSSGTAERLRRLLGVEAMAVARPSVDRMFRRSSDEEIAQCLKSYGIDTGYFLAVATWEPRKNLELLISAYLRMRDEGLLTGYKLVLVGGRGWKDDKLADLISKTGSQSVLPLGYVPDEQLPILYSGAEAFVFPSSYEGFGMPVLEARACGTKVVAADIPEIREAGGTDGLYIEPSSEGIRKGLADIISAPPPKLDPDSCPTWEQTAAIIAAALRGNPI